jgi:DNA replication and repair protein RecF
LIIRHLSLTNYRNYSSLDLDLPSGASVLIGDNAQGKSNLLEAVYLLATSKSHRTATDAELINWDAFDSDAPVCRVVADVEKASSHTGIEIAIGSRDSLAQTAVPSPSQQAPLKSRATLKRIKVNGIARRAADLVGHVNVVPFSVHDIDIVGGEPALRRRYLDAAISQVNREYLRQLQRYNRVLQQRNRLLRQIADNRANPDALAVWDDELVRAGSYLTVQREVMVGGLSRRALDIQRELSGSQAILTLAYLRSIDKGSRREDSGRDEISGAFARALEVVRSRELAQGVSLVGPHRDDLRIYEDGIDMGIFGSRGQQRTLALSLKLAEAAFMLEKTGEHPVLLLDDVLSELDSARRQHLLRYVGGYEQVLLAATDLDDFDPGFLAAAALFKVSEGSVHPLER